MIFSKTVFGEAIQVQSILGISALLPVTIPLFASLFLSFFKFKESNTRILARFFMAVSLLSTFGIGGYFFLSGIPEVSFSWPLFHVNSTHFDFSWWLDTTGIVFLTLSQTLSALVIHFSQYYLHKEPGYQRFFSTLFLFLSGLSLIAISNDLDTLFMGWECVGIASYLLISFYSARELPIRQATLVFAVYRICDVGLLAGAYVEHHFFHHWGFSLLNDPSILQEIPKLTSELLPLGLLLLLSASGKSAQFPWSFWIPRAMEGPTPSSAIFYGALSIHCGAFLLLRTYPLWSVNAGVVMSVFAVGGITAITAHIFSTVQSSIKGKIAYEAASQVGIIFVELALGFPRLALIHLVSHALFRCYQLLISPSIVAHRVQQFRQGLITDQHPRSEKLPPHWVRTIKATVYVFALNEGYIPYLMGRLRDFRMNHRLSSVIFTFLFYFAGGFVVWGVDLIPLSTLVKLVIISGSLSALVFLLDSSATLFHVALKSSVAILFLYGSLLVGDAHGTPWSFLSLIFISSLIGWVATRNLLRKKPFLQWLGTLVLIGFPISPLFFGEDYLLHLAFKTHPYFALGFTLCFITQGIALVRAYGRELFKNQRRTYV